jgi:AcrR family transcriptional regulator
MTRSSNTASNHGAKKPKRRMSGEARKRQIMDCAARVFAAKGFRGTTTKDIAHTCSINEAVIYHHFRSKEELFGEVLNERIEATGTSSFLEQLPSDRPVETILEAVATRILEISLQDPLVQKLLIAATVDGNESTRRLFLNWRLPFVSYLERIFAAGVRDGTLQTIDPLLTARAFVGLVMDCALSCNLWSELGYTSPDPKDLIANNVPIFVRGLMRIESRS